MGANEPASRRVTLADVAARAGVSRSLASLVIRNDPGPSAASRQAVQDAAAALQYQPDQAARLLREQRSRLLGVVIDAGDPFHADLLEELYPAAESAGYDVVLGARLARRSAHQTVEGLLRSRCEGLAMIGGEETADEIGAFARRTPVVLVGRTGRAAGVDAVVGADERGAAAATEHLLEWGHRRVCFVDGGRHPGASARRRGYRRAMRRHGLPPDIVPGDHTEPGGFRAAVDILRGNTDATRAGAAPMTAVVASNDRTALGLLEAALRQGVRVPEDLSIVGYDDSRSARLPYIELTTVAQDTAALAGGAVAAVVGRLTDGDARTRVPTDRLIEPTLVVRGTSGPCP